MDCSGITLELPVKNTGLYIMQSSMALGGRGGGGGCWEKNEKFSCRGIFLFMLEYFDIPDTALYCDFCESFSA